MRNRRKLGFITMHSLIRISKILKAGVAKNPVSELMNGDFFNTELQVCIMNSSYSI